jgi:phage shock protein A
MALKGIVRKQSKVEKLRQQVADLQQQVQEFKQYAISGKAYPVHDNAARKLRARSCLMS